MAYAFEPADALRQAAVPVLAMTGSKDIQVDPAAVDLMAEAVSTAFTGHVVDDLTHLLRREPGQPTLGNYKKQARRPIDQRVGQLITDWATETLGSDCVKDHP